MSRSFPIIVFSTMYLGWMASPLSWAQPGRTDSIARTGLAVPGGNGTFATFEEALIQSSGTVAWFANLAGSLGGLADNVAIYRGDGMVTTQLAREGQAAPDGNGLLAPSVTGSSLPLFNFSGTATILATLTDTSGGTADNRAIYVGSGGAITQVVRKGQADTDGNGAFTAFSSVAGIAGNGSVSFRATTSGTNGSEGIYRWTSGALTQIMRQGLATPNGNGVFSNFDSPIMLPSDQLIVRADLNGTTGGTIDDAGIFHVSPGGTITQLLREGVSSPDGNGVINAAESLSANDSGRVAFHSTLTGTVGGANDDTAVLSVQGGFTSMVVREGQTVPDGNGQYAQFPFHRLASNGDVVWMSQLRNTSGGSTDGQGIFASRGGTIRQIARAGEAAPGGIGTLGNFNALGMAVNGSGAVIFRNNLVGTPGGASDNFALMIADGTVTIVIAREGDALGTSTIADLVITDADPSSPKAMNDAGQVVYRAILADGNHHVERWTPNLRWRGAAFGNWSDSANWTLGLNPSTPHDVVLDPPANLSVNGPAVATTIRQLRIGGGAGQSHLILSPGGTIMPTLGTSIMAGGKLAGTGRLNGVTMNQTGGLISATDTQQLTFGDLVQDGTLEIDASSSVTVNGTYSGQQGFTGGGELRIRTGLSPGNSPAQLTVNGLLTLGGESTTRMELGGRGATEFDSVSVSGTVLIDQGDLIVETIDLGTGRFEPSFGDVFPLISAGNGFAGPGFENVTLPELSAAGGLYWRLEYRPTRVQISVSSPTDFNQDGGVNCDDVDRLVMGIVDQTHDPLFDLTGDGLVKVDDLVAWRMMAGAINLLSGNSYLPGDANLDGVVDGSDFGIWNANKFTSVAAWCSGDFSADGVVDGSDFGIWNSNKFTSSNSGTAVVPEPSGLEVPMFIMTLAAGRYRRWSVRARSASKCVSHLSTSPVSACRFGLSAPFLARGIVSSRGHTIAGASGLWFSATPGNRSA